MLRIKYKQISLTDETDGIQTTAILLHEGNLVIVSIYIAPQTTKQIIQHTITKIIHNTRNYKKIIITGDFNAHHTFWGDDKIDQKGQAVLDEIDNSNLIILNYNKLQQ